ncbi:MAG: hypothetical protein OYL92_10260 [Acidobacteriota bacterium]|nr:hypothetical protein [Acidobacteriota bacterium]MDE3265342.1 hypothetical protein [Acidobacteriota bacterium]
MNPYSRSLDVARLQRDARRATRFSAIVRARAQWGETRLADYAGVFDVSDSFLPAKRELRLELDPRAEALGRQIRQGFYGAEAQRIQRGRDDIRVMVR